MSSIASASVKALPPLVGGRGHGGRAASVVKCTSDTSAANNNKKKVLSRATRRQLVGGTAALLVTVPQLPALAESEVSFAEGPEGISYADVTVGSGESPFEGDGKDGAESVLSLPDVWF